MFYFVRRYRFVRSNIGSELFRKFEIRFKWLGSGVMSWWGVNISDRCYLKTLALSTSEKAKVPPDILNGKVDLLFSEYFWRFSIGTHLENLGTRICVWITRIYESEFLFLWYWIGDCIFFCRMVVWYIANLSVHDAFL